MIAFEACSVKLLVDPSPLLGYLLRMNKICAMLSLTLALTSASYGIEVRLRNWGLYNGINNSHVQAVDAWSVTQGSRKIVVAVIDTGIDVKHPDLADNIWHDPETGYYGWDFVKDQPNPVDHNGHGTHVAGIIGSLPNPVSGTSGVSHLVSLMAIRYYSDFNTGPENLRNSIRAVNWAIDHGANVINYSSGGAGYSNEEYKVLKKAEAHNVLVVVAAGNEGQNIDQIGNRYYPCSYKLTNIMCVASMTLRNTMLSSSNWGKHSVDVAAPGENIISTFPDGKYGYMSGTSQATAFVTGTAVLILSKHPNMSPSKVRAILRASVDQTSALVNRTISGGKLNAYSALLR